MDPLVEVLDREITECGRCCFEPGRESVEPLVPSRNLQPENHTFCQEAFKNPWLDAIVHRSSTQRPSQRSLRKT